MNALSWFLYLSDVVTSLSTILGVGLFVSFIVSCVITAFINNDTSRHDAPWWWPVKTWIAICALTLVLALLPSKNTMYAIAASEIGEKVVKSETVQGITNDVTEALQQWIKRQIDPPGTK